MLQASATPLIALDAVAIDCDASDVDPLRAAAPVPLSREMVRALAAGVTEVFVLSEDYAACGQTLRELGLRRETGVLVLAVLRDNVPRPNPSPDLALQSGDQLVLVGSHAEIDRALEFLARPARVVN